MERNPSLRALSIVLTLAVAGYVLSLISVGSAGLAARWSDHPAPWTAWGLGWGPICAEAGQQVTAVAESKPPEIPGLHRGAEASISGIELCTNQTHATQRLQATLTSAPLQLVYGLVVLGLWRLVQAARRETPFAQTVVGRARLLGWFVLVAGPVAGAIQEISRLAFVGSLYTPLPFAPGPDASMGLVLQALPYDTVLFGLGFLTLASLLRAGAQMRDDLAGTV